MKAENVIELIDSDDDNDVVQPQNDKAANKIGLNSPAVDTAKPVVKMETVEEPECKPPASVQVGSTTPNDSGSQAAKYFERFGKRIFTIVPTNQMPAAPDSGQHFADFDMDVDPGLVPNSITSNDSADNRAEMINSVMNDHQYAKPQAPTGLVADGSSALAYDDTNGESSKRESNAEVSIKIEPTINNVDPPEKGASSQQVVDLISDGEDVADSTVNCDDDNDAQVQPPTHQRQNVYNTRAGGHFKAGHWQKITGHSTADCEHTECCVFCTAYLNTHEKLHKCTKCAKRFVRKSALTRHMKIHENQFCCSVCHIGLPDAKSCQSHKYDCKFTRFECYLCKKEFCDNGEMVKHVKSVHIYKDLRRSTRQTRFRPKYSFNFNKYSF